MLGVAVTLAILFLLIASIRLFAEVVVAMGNDPTGEMDEQLNIIVSVLRESQIHTVMEMSLLLGIVVWIYFSGFVLCAQLIFASIAAIFWPQRYFK
jgi:Na+-transporting methylmalonyl-CoA/oxaloacetate decarboxylase gamma subunit